MSHEAATYSTPSWEAVQRLTGINAEMLGLEDADTEDTIDDLLTTVEQEARLRVGGDYFDDETTLENATNLERGVAYLVAEALLLNLRTRIATGTQEPLENEGSEDVASLADDYRTKALALFALVVDNASASANTTPQYKHAFSTDQAESFTDSDSTRTRSFRRNMVW